MANTGLKGIDVRQTGNELVFRTFLQDSSGAKVTTGTTTIAIYELQSDGTIKSYDFSDNTFKTTALTTATGSMTHRTGNNSTVNTGVWTYALSTLTGFTSGSIYLAQVNNSGASPTDQVREFQYGSAEGDLLVTAGSTGQAYVQGDTIKVGGTTQTARDLGASVLLSSGTGTGQVTISSGVVSANATQINSDGTAPGNLANMYNGTGYVAATAPAQQQQLANIAATSSALNATAASNSITTGTETGTYANAATLDGVYDVITAAGGAIDLYYQFNVSGTTGATGVGTTWNGYVVGAVNTLKVYAYNWGGSAWDQIGTIVGSSSVTVNEQEFDLTSAHTGTGGNLGLVRIRFAATGLTAGVLNTDRLLMGYTVVLTPPSNWSIQAIDGSGRVDVGKILGTASAGTAGYFAPDWGHVNAPTTTVDLSGTTIKGIDGVTFPATVSGLTQTQVSGYAGPILTDNSTGLVTANATKIGGQTATLNANNILKVSLNDILATTLTETSSGYLAAAFKKLFDVAIPVSTTASVNQTGDSYAVVNSGSFGNSALLSAIQNVQNNTFIATSIPSMLERPDSGNTSISISIVFSDETGTAKNLDSGSPTITLVNDAGTDKSSRLGAITNLATGKYVVAYTNTSTDTIEGLHWDITGTINSKLRRMVAYTQIVDTTAVDFTSSDRTALNAIQTQAALIATNAADSPNAVTAHGTIATNLNATVSSRMATYTQPTGFLAATFPTGTIANTTNIAAGTVTISVGTGTGQLSIVSGVVAASGNWSTVNPTNADTSGITTLLGRIGVAGEGLTAIGDTRLSHLDADVSSRMATFSYTSPDNTTLSRISGMLESSGPTYRFTTPALANAPSGGGGGSSGNGDTPVTQDTGGTDNLRLTTSGGAGIDNATVTAYLKSEWDSNPITAVVRAQAYTKSDGRWVESMMLNAGLTYTFVFAAVGYVVTTKEATI